jgi:acylphosphatase
MQKKFRLVLSGKVQAVNFRQFAKQNAGKLGVYGHARNLKDGNLEIVARGEESKVSEFIRICERGPMFANVREVSKDELPVDEEEDDYFDIRY